MSTTICNTHMQKAQNWSSVLCHVYFTWKQQNLQKFNTGNLILVQCHDVDLTVHWQKQQTGILHFSDPVKWHISLLATSVFTIITFTINIRGILFTILTDYAENSGDPTTQQNGSNKYYSLYIYLQYHTRFFLL